MSIHRQNMYTLVSPQNILVIELNTLNRKEHWSTSASSSTYLLSNAECLHNNRFLMKKLCFEQSLYLYEHHLF